MTTRDRLRTLMADHVRRTSYEIATALFGPGYAPADWFRLSALCDQLVTPHVGLLRHCSKNRAGRSVYEIAS